MPGDLVSPQSVNRPPKFVIVLRKTLEDELGGMILRRAHNSHAHNTMIHAQMIMVKKARAKNIATARTLTQSFIFTYLIFRLFGRPDCTPCVNLARLTFSSTCFRISAICMWYMHSKD